MNYNWYIYVIDISLLHFDKVNTICVPNIAILYKNSGNIPGNFGDTAFSINNTFDTNMLENLWYKKIKIPSPWGAVPFETDLFN
ncbi:MAG TPA: hypothetical protein DCO80_13170 [Ornithinibacillus sp.]|nr:hypothetical protein [Ornithinibacillus sp.]